VVASDGTIYNLVSDADKAWHASSYNSRSIGIEVIGFSSKPETWTRRNIDALAELFLWLSLTYDIPLEYEAPGTTPSLSKSFVAHGAIDPGRRYDPGPHFPWNLIANKAASANVQNKVASMIESSTQDPLQGSASEPTVAARPDTQAHGHEDMAG